MSYSNTQSISSQHNQHNDKAIQLQLFQASALMGNEYTYIVFGLVGSLNYPLLCRVSCNLMDTGTG